jgi:predicted enzyme related to lactoylglutathione lyase
MGTLVIFAVNVKVLASFYEAVLGLTPTPKPGDTKKDIRLGGKGIELLIHSIPPGIAKTIVIESPPVPRDIAAMKPVFDVKSLSKAEEQVTLRGGVVTKVTFTVDGLTRRDVLDPEGNLIQLRSAKL